MKSTVLFLGFLALLQLSTGHKTASQGKDAVITPFTDYAVRLAGGPDATQGRIELLIAGEWGTVCDTGFTDTEAGVACTSLGFNAGQGSFLGNQFGPGAGPVYLDNVACTGSEFVLDDCAHSEIGDTTCTHDQDVSVSCTGTGYTARLTGASNTYEGRLEILYRNQWGSVCDHSFDARDAQVACNSLGFGYIGYALGNVFGRGSGEIWLDEVECEGDEANVGNCAHNPWGVSDCVHFDDISISCSPLDVAVRLVNGGSETEGRYEMFFNGQWGTVCAAGGFSDVEAQVACYSLGFDRGVGTFLGSQFGPGFGPVWMDSVACDGSEDVLNECQHSPVGDSNCTHDQDVSISCTGTGYQFRLADGDFPYEGRLEVNYQGEWGTVCSDNFDVRDAQVACASLGQGRAGYSVGSVFGRGDGTIMLDEVNCLGDESNIGYCQHNPWTLSNCVHFQDVGVSCTPLDVAVRLADGSTATEGRLEHFFNGEWGTVCDTGFTNVEAQVACYSLGFDQGQGTFLGNQFGPGTGQIWLDNVHCNGNETVINGCEHAPWGEINCTHANDVSISCVGTGYGVRLVEGTASYEGRLEVNYQGEWGTVCSDVFDARDAQVACASLGFGHTGYSLGTEFGGGQGTIMLDDVECVGDEDNIGNCAHLPWTFSNCIHALDVSIACTTVDVAIRLVDGATETEGRVETFISGQWGTICDSGFGTEEAQVACYSLGFDQGQGVFLGNQFGPGSGQIWLDNVDCAGTESVLNECQHSQIGSSNCTHDSDVSISCTGTGYPLRLVGGTFPKEGRLEVFYRGEWGTVCDDTFTNVDAQVACYGLGHGRVGRIQGTSPGTGTIWLDDVACTGSESNIGNCAHAPWGFTNCVHREDVSITCSTSTGINYALRLVGSDGLPAQSSGRLEINQGANEWGTVCDTDFSDVDAQVACASLGFTQYAGSFIGQTHGEGTGRVWLDNVNCTGNEIMLDDCQHSPWGSSTCNHTNDVSISCSGPWPAMPVRLINPAANTTTPTEGRLEIFYFGLWGTVCDDAFNDVNAQVVCASLGFGYTGEFVFNLYGSGEGQIWLDDVTCDGNELSIGTCGHSPWGESNCQHSQDVSIRCVPVL